MTLGLTGAVANEYFTCINMETFCVFLVKKAFLQALISFDEKSELIILPNYTSTTILLELNFINFLHIFFSLNNRVKCSSRYFFALIFSFAVTVSYLLRQKGGILFILLIC